MKKYIVVILLLGQFSLYAKHIDLTAAMMDTVIPIASLDVGTVPDDTLVLRTYSQSVKSYHVLYTYGELVATDDYSQYTIDHPVYHLPERVASALYKDHKVIADTHGAILPVDKGILFGFAGGEFFNGLFWYAYDGSASYKIRGEGIRKIIQRVDTIFAIEGLLHLNVSRGRVITLDKKGDKWQALPYLELPEAPVAMAVDNANNLIIVTSNSLVKVNAGRMDYLIENAFWNKDDYLYPNSLVVLNDIVYIGMRAGVFKYDLKTKASSWLTKQRDAAPSLYFFQ